MEQPAPDTELQPPAKKVCTDATPAVDLPATPEYHQKRLYEVSWNKSTVYPCLIVDIKDLPAEALETYKSSNVADKVPVKNFCDEEKTLYIHIHLNNYSDVVSAANLVPFSSDVNYSYLTNIAQTEKLQPAFTTAYVQ